MPNTEGPTLSLGLDASAAERGAKSFADAIDRIISAGKRAADAVDSLGGETRDLAPGMDKAGDAAGRLRREVDDAGASARRTKTDFVAAGQGVAGLGQAFSFAQSMVAGFAAGIGVGAFRALSSAIAAIPGQLIEVGDAYTRLDARLSQAIRGLNDAGAAHRDLLDVSQKLGVAFDSTANFFVRIASQSKDLGLSYSDLVTITKTLEGAFKLSGASAGETSAAMMQLGQAFASGKLQGDEFRSVAENAPLVLDRMAEALGVTRGELLQMASAGQLTTNTVARAIKSMASGVESDLQSMGSTVSEASARMGNAWKELLAELNRTGGVSEVAIGALNSITAVLSSPTTLDAINLYAKSWSLLGEGVKLGAKIIGEGIAALQAYPKSLETLVGTRDLAAEKITRTLRGLPQVAEGAPPVTSADYGGTPAMRAAQQAELERGMRAAEVPGLMAAISKQPLLPKVPAARGGGRAAAEPKLQFDAKPFEDEITALNQRSEGAMTKTQQHAQDMLASITEAYASAFADQARIIEMKRDKDMEAINLAALNADQKARARTMVEEASSHQILLIRQRELDQSLGYMEQLEQAYNKQFRLDQTGNRNREIQRGQQLRQLEQQQGLTPEQRVTARQQIIDMTQPLNDVQRAGEAMVEFGDRMTGMDATIQGVIQGISQVGSTASSAFADAVIAGESFDETLAKLGESLARMMIQMTMQLAMQQAIGAAVGGIGGLFAPQPGAGAGATGPAAVGMSPMYAMARGGVFEADLRSGVYTHPTYFDVRPIRRLAKGDVTETGLSHGVYTQPTLFPLEEPGFRTFARGTGMLGEAGPEAVLPLTRTPSGELGVQSQGTGSNVEVNVVVNNQSGAQVRTESRGNAQGGKDVILTIADAVEGLLATRMNRSGTLINRAVGGVGQVQAR